MMHVKHGRGYHKQVWGSRSSNHKRDVYIAAYARHVTHLVLTTPLTCPKPPTYPLLFLAMVWTTQRNNQAILFLSPAGHTAGAPSVPKVPYEAYSSFHTLSPPRENLSEPVSSHSYQTLSVLRRVWYSMRRVRNSMLRTLTTFLLPLPTSTTCELQGPRQ